MKIQNVKLGVRQWLVFGGLLLAMAGVSFFSIDRMNGLREEIDELNSYWIPGVSALSEINLDVSNLRMLQLELALNDFDIDAVPSVGRAVAWFDSIDANLTGLEMRDSLHSDAYDEERRAQLSAFDANWDDFQLEYMNLFNAISPDEANQMLRSAGIRFELLTENLEALIDINKQSSTEAAFRARESFLRTRGIIIFVLLGTIAMSIMVAGALIRSLTAPIKELEEAAEAVAGGDLSVRIKVNSEDEIGNLARSFNNMTQSLSVAQEQLVMKEKMASLGQLTAGIAHEIKNPLNFVNNFAVLTGEIAAEFAEELEENKDKTVQEVIEEFSELLNDLRFNTGKIVEHGARADGIVRSMLQHSRGRPGEQQKTNLNQFLSEYVNLAYHGMRASTPDFRARLERNLDPTIGKLNLVPQDMGRVFINLLNNAFHAVYEKSKAGEAFEPVIDITTHRHNDRVEISFKDNGGGIPEHLIKKIFDPFFTTKPTGQGTGLGLSLSYEIVTRVHGGTMNVISEEGVGSEFVIDLPIT